MEEAREFQKNIYFCFIDYTKVFDCMDHNKLWKILQEMGIPDHLTCLLKNLYADFYVLLRKYKCALIFLNTMQVRKQQLELDMEQ